MQSHRPLNDIPRPRLEALLEVWEQRYWEVRQQRRLCNNPPDPDDCIDECREALEKILQEKE
jgi:hypothetical protein